MFKLRDYQQCAVDSALYYLKDSSEPILIEAATGAGKAICIAEIAKVMHERTNKKILVTAPSRELVLQNAEKFKNYGYTASIFSASAGSKSIKGDVVFGTPQSIKNSLYKFDDFGMIIIDEAHGITPTMKKIIESMRESNPGLKILGLTATPYRMGKGYIYAVDENGLTVDEAVDPFFMQLAYKITANELIKKGFLTEPVADHVIANQYDTHDLKLKKNGQFDEEDIARIFNNDDSLTAQIVNDILDKTVYKKGVMIFGATIKHAEKILSFLPKNQSAIVTGSTKPKERTKIINDFKAKKIKYIVNVGTLTTGFDAPHVDCVAILRATESAALFQQIIGRGLRIDNDKSFCLILDYAGNIDRHNLHDNFFNPKIKTTRVGSGEKFPFVCPVCDGVNMFSIKQDYEGLPHDEFGYIKDLSGLEFHIDGKQVPVHYGRRCQIKHFDSGIWTQCTYKWSFKECEECGFENDLTARYCKSCKCELISPEDKLVAQYQKVKRDPYSISSDKVLDWSYRKTISRKGNECLVIHLVTEYRTFDLYFLPTLKTRWYFMTKSLGLKDCNTIDDFINAKPQKPATATTQKKGDFFELKVFNEPESHVV